jgi:hypothetical protein
VLVPALISSFEKKQADDALYADWLDSVLKNWDYYARRIR